jgi:hypothetical protein
MSYGIEIYDENGNIYFDNDKLKHRIWWQNLITSSGNYYYDTALDNEPTIVCYSVTGGVPFVWNHITSNVQYTGIEVVSDDRANSNTIFIVFARR